MKSERKGRWIGTKKDELQSLHDNHTFESVTLPNGEKALKIQWVYKLKQKENSTPVKGYSQIKGIDSEEIFLWL